jgi:hypothetical protein
LIWKPSGDVQVDGTNFQLSTNASDDDDLGLSGEFKFSDNPATSVGFDLGFGKLEDFLGIDVTELDIDGFAYEGSAIRTNLNLNSRTEVSFNWEFLTNETSDALSVPLLDYGFFFIGDTITKLADVADIKDTDQTTCNFDFDTCTGVQTETYTLNPGDYTFGFGVIDINDYIVTSALTVSNFTLTPISQPPTTIPEPNLMFGIFTMAGLGSKFLRQKPR